MRFVIAITFACLATAVAGSPCVRIDDPERRLACYDDLAECAQLEQSEARLRCFDVGFAVVPQPSAEPARAVATDRSQAGAPRGGTQRSERDNPPNPVPGSPTEDHKIVARIVDVRENHLGQRYLTLDNGQIWREISETRFDYEPGSRVEISRGVFGSTNLTAEGMETYTKVKRVR